MVNSNNTVKPLVLTNGVLMQTTSWGETKGHLDKSHLMYLNRSNGPTTDLGIIQPFVTAGHIMKPYHYSFSNLGKSRKYVNSHIFTWKHPIHDEACSIVEDLSNTDKPGIAGEKFRIKVSTDRYDNGYVIGVDQHSPDMLLITEDPIIPDGDGFIITVKYLGVNQAERWFPKEYLSPHTKLFPIFTVGTEYSQTVPTVASVSGGMREYFNVVGEGHAELQYSITREAYYSPIKKEITKNLNEYRKVIEMYAFKPGSMGYDLSLKGQMTPYNRALALSNAYNGDMERMKYDIAGYAWVPEVEALGMAQLESMVEAAAIWGPGGVIDYDGRSKTSAPLGLFHQLNKGGRHVYDLNNWTIEKFEFIITDRLKHRLVNNPDNVITIKTGLGGLAWVRNQLRNKPGSAGMLTHSKDYIGNLGSLDQVWKPGEFTGWRMQNGYGTLKFELAPGLDPIDANDMVNPVVPTTLQIGGHRLSSYMFIIEDITNTDSDNIVELVYGPDWDFKKRHISGKLDYMGKDVFASASHHPGFQVIMSKRYKCYWVKDATKALLIKPINPFTGRALWSSYHGD